jgi:hypothetical protein
MLMGIMIPMFIHWWQWSRSSEKRWVKGLVVSIRERYGSVSQLTMS